MGWLTAALLTMQAQSGDTVQVLRCVREVSPAGISRPESSEDLARAAARACMRARYRSTPFDICVRRVGMFIRIRSRQVRNPAFDPCVRREESVRADTEIRARGLALRIITEGRGVR